MTPEDHSESISAWRRDQNVPERSGTFDNFEIIRYSNDFKSSNKCLVTSNLPGQEIKKHSEMCFTSCLKNRCFSTVGVPQHVMSSDNREIEFSEQKILKFLGSDVRMYEETKGCLEVWLQKHCENCCVWPWDISWDPPGGYELKKSKKTDVFNLTVWPRCVRNTGLVKDEFLEAMCTYMWKVRVFPPSGSTGGHEFKKSNS